MEISLKRVPVSGIGPLFKAYESFVLPLNYTGDTMNISHRRQMHIMNDVRVYSRWEEHRHPVYRCQQ